MKFNIFNKTYYILMLILIPLLVITACSGNGDEPPNESQKNGEEAITDINNDTQEEEEDKDKEEAKRQCTYCGKQVKEDVNELSRPIVVTYGNHPKERPQSGLEDACVVYEVPVEGGLSRLFAVFHHEVEGRIGPVRSARFYFIDMTLAHDAMYAHVGGHQPALNKIQEIGLATLDQMIFGGAYWRSSNKSAPYNMYTNMENLLSVADRQGYRVEGDRELFIPYREEPIDDAEVVTDIEDPITSVSINYNSSYNYVSYDLDHDTGAYHRTVNNDPHQDKEQGEQVSADNLIIQYVSSRVMDDVGRLELDLVGSGEGYLIQNGEKQEITWNKDANHKPTNFYNENGEEIILNPGQTWVNIVPYGTNIEFDS